MIFIVQIGILGIVRFMFYELITVIMVWWLGMTSNSFERMSALSYIMWYSFVLGFLLVMNFDLGVIRLLVGLIRFSKLPVFRLHRWLPKIHVEASIVRSIVLAGLILKVGIVFCSFFVNQYTLILMGMWIAGFIMFNADGKVVMAYSSVVHISMCAFIFRYFAFIVGLTHVVVSPLIFIAVYVRYGFSGIRLLSKSFMSYVIRSIMILNLRFPMIRAFLSELILIIQLAGVMFIVFRICYVMIGIVSIKIYFSIKRDTNIEFIRWLIILCVLY